MEIRGNIALASKVCLVVTLLLVGLTFFGCTVRSSPQGGSGGVVANGVLFLCPALKQTTGGFGCAAPQTEGKLIAVNTSDGSRRWETPLKPSTPPGGGYGCAPAPIPAAIYGNPAILGDLVYVGGYNGKIYAVNSSSGALRWVYPRDDNLRPIIGGVLTAQGKVYFGCSDGKVYALDAATGDKQWEFPTGDKIWSTPVIQGNTLYIGSFDKKLYALNASDGTKKWAFPTEGAIISTPLVYDNTVYIGSFDRHFYAVDAVTGKPKWPQPFETGSWFWAKPVVYNNIVYAPCLDGKVYALDAKTGAQVVEPFDLGSPISSSPVLVSNKVIVATESGVVYAVDTDNNKREEMTRLKTQQGKEETVHAPLSASDGAVYIYTQEQNLYALSAESGTTLWGPVSIK